MKTIKNIFILGLVLISAASCMNDFDVPDFKNPPYGNNTIGNANTTIADLKKKYSSAISASSVQEITEDIIVEGVVVSNDISGNVYKQFVIDDGTGAIIVGVNDTGLYAIMAMGQKIVLNCKGLHIGGYGKLAQIGGLYNGGIGRMSPQIFKEHVKLVGEPSLEENGIFPEVIDGTFIKSENLEYLPKYVRINNVHFEEADGLTKYAPEDEISNDVVERTIKLDGNSIVFRLSPYANFAEDILYTGNFDIIGVLTRFTSRNSNSVTWQFMLTSTDDIIPVE